jgi:hypothetical protein
MGSFAITYDDFTGGHYMGNRDTAQPSNTWTGTNTMLDPRGNLIATSSPLLETLSGPVPNPGDTFTIDGVFTVPDYVVIFHTYYNAFTATRTSKCNLFQISTNTFSFVAITLAGNPQGFIAPDQSTDKARFYYVDATGNIRLVEFTYKSPIALAQSLVTATTNVKTSLYKYKYRLLGIGLTGTIRNRLLYSDPTMTTWGATDYYEFPGQITNIAPRTNDLVVTTTAGIYSVTGVFGESVNIQEIFTFAEMSQGMTNPVTYGRDFIYLNDYLDSMNGKVFAGLGTNKSLIATLDLEAEPPLNIALINPGLVAIASETGYAYIMDTSARWARSVFSNWQANDIAVGGSTSTSGSVGTAAVTLANLPGNMYFAEPAIKPYERDITDVVAYLIRTNNTDIKVYATVHTAKDPVTNATGSVLLAEYWHNKPMVVREVIVEVEYVATTTGGSVAVNIIPTGAVDINSTVAQTMTSSTITAPSESTASTIIHRFRANNAGRAYGFKPNITHKGVRIRRVICVCED